MRVVSNPPTAFKAATILPAPRVLVPTMGALHAGHGALLKKARRLAGKGGSVMVSIFVNPLQFGPREDLAKYPRPRAADLALCREAGVDLVFAPAPEAMYAADFSLSIDETRLSQGLCGASRPGHFRGVCTVVGKLFHLLQPQIAVFGEKDYQQLAIIRRMVRDLDFPVKIVGLPTVREADGLALSSRNRFLTPELRASAPVIYRSLREARQRVADGELDAEALIKNAINEIETAGGKIDYVAIVDATTLDPRTEVTGNCVMLIAAFFGDTRLIDNLPLTAAKGRFNHG